jgi:hypothetical protein
MTATQTFPNVRKLASLISKETWEALKPEEKKWSEKEYDHLARLSFKVGLERVYWNYIILTDNGEHDPMIYVEWVKVSQRKGNLRKFGFRGQVRKEELDAEIKKILDLI